MEVRSTVESVTFGFLGVICEISIDGMEANESPTFSEMRDGFWGVALLGVALFNLGLGELN